MSSVLINYIAEVCSAIISNTFSMKVRLRGHFIKQYLTEDQRKEITRYKQKGCISPAIYNFVYLYMRKVVAMNREIIIYKLKEQVEEQKRKYEVICKRENEKL